MSRLYLGALILEHHLVAAAGFGGYAPAAAGQPDMEAQSLLGAFVTAGVRWHTRRGRWPRLTETPAGAVYDAGTGGCGVGDVLRRAAPRWAAAPAPVIVNLCAAEPAEFAATAAALEGVRGAAALELNLGGVDEQTGEAFAADAATVQLILRDVRRVCGLPLLAKLPADAPALEEALRVCAAAGAAGVTIGGGLAASGGRLVGPATFPVVLDTVQRVAAGAPLPVMAGGGVVAAAQVRAYRQAGAAAVQVGSAYLANPRVIEDIARG